MIRIATRNSQLALMQANMVRDALLNAHSHLDASQIVLVPLKSDGDKNTDISLQHFGFKGAFTKRIEQALLQDEADIAVHSMKDVACDIPDSLTIPAIMEREDVRDAWISPRGEPFAELKAAAIIGTASVRRTAMLKALRPDSNVSVLRGNVQTRLDKADEFDGILLAAAGLKRLNLHDAVTEYFDPDMFLPAAGQGAVGVQCRSDDNAVLDLLKPLNHSASMATVSAERVAIGLLDADCSTPVGAYAAYEGQEMTLCLRYYAQSGEILAETTKRGANPQDLGTLVGEEIRRQLASCS